MKIALLSEKYTPDIGGLAISTGRLSHLLAKGGHDVRAIAPSGSLPPSEKRTLPSSGVSVTRFGARKRSDDTLVDWFELLSEEHRRDPFDVIHAYFLPQAGFVAAYAGKYLNVPSVVSIRGNDIERAPFDGGKFSHVMYALQHASAVTTNAGILAQKAKAFFDREIVLIPNGIDTELFKPMERNEMLFETLDSNGLPLESAQHTHPGTRAARLHRVIGFVGELREKKGQQTLLSAYAQVNKVQPSTLLIVGEVRQGEDKKLFDELKDSIPNANIIVTGLIPHKDLPAYYSLMDVFVHPSLRDGMPNAVLEAMACGKTVIATPVGGVTDVIEDGVNGMLVQVNDVSELAGKMAEALSLPEKRDAVGRSARETILSHFTLEKELQANLNLYQKINSMEQT
jgi:glycosyltransferase involved in cell wall biosynthesis